MSSKYVQYVENIYQDLILAIRTTNSSPYTQVSALHSRILPQTYSRQETMLVGHNHAYYASPTYGRTNLVPILEYLLAPLESIPILSIGLTQNIRNSSIALSVRVLPRFPLLFRQFFDSLSGFLSSSFEMLRNLLLLVQSGLILTVFYSIS